jgi:sterol desaturase/sphingolipid hydroxylase (fatty acid hydroxylase superfamily)
MRTLTVIKLFMREIVDNSNFSFDEIMQNNWIMYGVLPLIGSGLGFFLTYALVVILEHSGVLKEKNSIVYNSSKTRSYLLTQTQERVPLSIQLRSSVYNTCGLPAILNAIGSAIFLPMLIKIKSEYNFIDFLKEFMIMQLIGDLFLYWGHRIQHENAYFWKHFHSIHHQIDTPKAYSVAYIHPVDAFLQGALPILLAGICAQCHPFCFCFYVFTRVAENTINHCGYDHWLINVIFLKILPFRASIRHHDEHHKFSKSGGGKNFGENYVIWDWIFKTLRPPITTRD